MKFKLKVVIISAILTFSVLNGIAQEGLYWSEKYGNRSMLLSGTVNASVEDLGTVFYNPGRLALIENPAFAISARVNEWKTIKVEDNEEGLQLNQSNFGGAPSLAAGTFKVPFLKNHKFAYSFLTRNRNNLNFFTRIQREGDLIEGLPGNQDIFNSKLDVNRNFKDEWIGLTWAPPSKSKFGIGLSTFISTVDKSALLAVDMNALNEFNQAAYYSVDRRYSFGSYGILWKLGMAWDFEKIRLGVNVTTPRVNISGKGSALIEDYLVGVDTTGDGNTNDSYIFNNQDDLKAVYKSPLAIGFGIGIPLKNGVVHISAEWYDRISEYKILEIDPFVGQSTREAVKFALQDRLESVLNYGIGVEWHFSQTVSAYGSYATNFSGVPPDGNRLADFEETTSNSFIRANFLNLGGGVSISTRAVEITVGASYEGGSNNFLNQIDFPDEDNDTPEASYQPEISISTWRFILGFSFPFADKMLKELKEE